MDRRHVISIVAICIVLVGVALHLLRSVDTSTDDRRLVARGEGWVATTRDGDPIGVEGGVKKGLVLTEDSRLEFAPEALGEGRTVHLAFTLLRMVDESHVEIRFCESGDSAYVLKIAPMSAFGVTLLFEESDARPRTLAQVRDHDFVGKARQSFVVELTIDGPHIEAKVGGEVALSIDDATLSRGTLALVARTGALRVVDFVHPSLEDGSPPRREGFQNLQPAPKWRRLPDALLASVGVLLFIAFWFRSLCDIPPGMVRIVIATAIAATPMALARIATAPIETADGPLLGRLLVPLLLLGSIPGLYSLRDYIRSATGVRHPLDRFRIAILVAFFGGITGQVVRTHLDRHREPWVDQMRLANAESDPAPIVRPSSTSLGAANALTLPGRFRNLEINASITLDDEALLEARLRARGAEGVALFLSSDASMRPSFIRETRDEFETIGVGSPTATATVTPGDVHQLRITAIDDAFHAYVDGKLIVSAQEPLFPTGEIVWLAARGHVAISDFTVTPLPRERLGTESPARDVGIVLLPLAIAVAFSLIASRLLRRSFLRVFEPTLFAGVPLVIALHAIVDREPLSIPFAMHASIAVAMILMIQAILHIRSATFLRFQLALLLPILVSALFFHESQRRSWPASVERQNGLTPVDWSGDQIEDGLAHLQHPLLRRWNVYLIDHQFKRRPFTLTKPAGVTRILALGSSSTFGFGVDTDYPSLVEQRLNHPVGAKPSIPVEVMNGAFNGATGSRLLELLRGPLGNFHPDIITLSLYYNDSVILTQFDELSYLQKIRDPNYERTWLEDLKQRARITAGARRWRRLTQNFDEDDEVAWDDGTRPPPPVLFESMLREFARVAEEKGITLVLIQEPIAGDRPRLWKSEFRDAMTRVAQEFHLRVVDPTPALQAAGGAALFSDEVHPYADGHHVIADVVANALRDVMKHSR